ncbi:MAG: hypothetical protein V4463_13890 [Pseudomonadota bacterium]
MFGSTVLEVAIGLTFCYASLALIVSTVQEAIASALRLRARTLLAGIKTMFNDPHFNGLAQALYRHALINPHDDGKSGDPGRLANKPSYIDPRHFAMALIDTISGEGELAAAIAQLPDPQLRSVLETIHKRAGGDLKRFEFLVSNWFDNAMEQVSGSYKRRATLIGFVLALALAASFNIDSIHLFRTLWQHPALAAQLGAADPRVLDALWTLPIGWDVAPSFDMHMAAHIPGWLITASSALFGAPFWFDLLQKLVQVRGTGGKPHEKKKA